MRKAIPTLVLMLLLAPGAHAADPAGEAQLFPRPPAIVPQVEFWTRVYTEVGTDGGLIHDARHLDVVYEVIRLPRSLSRRSRERRIERAKDRYEKILRKLASGPHANLSQEELRVLRLWPRGVTRDTLRQAARRVRFQLGQAEKFRAGLQRAGIWEPHIREALAAHGVPEALAALPHVESSYNPRAISKAGAAGLWQFTYSTGRRYVRIDSAVDERFDPYRASEGAAELLRHNHERLGAWPLAITAYNHGASGMARAVRQLGTTDIGEIVQRYQSRRFGFASRNFYAEFLAALDVERNAERYFGIVPRTHAPDDFEVVSLDAYYPVSVLARVFGTDPSRLRELNPALRAAVWRGEKHVPRGFRLRLPRAADRPPATTVLASVPDSQRYSRQRLDRTYRVRRGDTLSRIARRFGIRERDLAAANGLRNRHRIRVGQTLRLPGRPAPVMAARAEPRKRAAARAVAKAAPPKLAADGTLVVRRGDTLSEIARRLGVRVDALAAANGIDRPERIRPGQRLRVPDAAPTRVARAETPAPPPRQTAPAPEPEPAAEAHTPESGTPAHPSDSARAAAEVEAPSPSAAAPSSRAAKPTAAPRPALHGPVLATSAHAASAPNASIAALPGPGALDRERFAVSPDGRVTVQAEETLGHLADWLEIPTQRLRELNGLGYRTPLALGRRIRLDFSHVTPEEFERRRLAYHRDVRARFYARHRISGTEEHVLRRGETLWKLSHQRYGLPLWLVSDYNPELPLGALRPGHRLRIPRVEPRST